MHLHGHAFRLLHALDDGWEPYFLDTVQVPENKTHSASPSSPTIRASGFSPRPWWSASMPACGPGSRLPEKPLQNARDTAPADPRRSDPARSCARPPRGSRRRRRPPRRPADALRHQPGDEPAEHIAGSRRRQIGRAVLVDGRPAVRRGDHRVRPLQHDHGPEIGGGPSRPLDFRRRIKDIRVAFEQAVELAVMGRDDRRAPIGSPGAVPTRAPRTRSARPRRAPERRRAWAATATMARVTGVHAQRRPEHQRVQSLIRQNRMQPFRHRRSLAA